MIHVLLLIRLRHDGLSVLQTGITSPLIAGSLQKRRFYFLPDIPPGQERAAKHPLSAVRCGFLSAAGAY